MGLYAYIQADMPGQMMYIVDQSLDRHSSVNRVDQYPYKDVKAKGIDQYSDGRP